MFCSNCGTEIDDGSILCSKCGSRVGATSNTSPSSQSDKPSTQLRLPNKAFAIGLLFILAGAILMLVALSLNWYTMRIAGDPFSGFGNNIDFDLLNESYFREAFKLNWSGIVLPLIFMIVFSSITILSTFYAIATGKRFKQLWGWLSFLSVAAIIANFLYLLVSFLSLDVGYGPEDTTLYATPHVGWVLAFIGAIVIGIGSRIK